MALFERKDTLDTFADLLDRERAAILKGDFAALKRMLAEKERLVALFRTGNQNGRDLHVLREKSANNNAMLLAATNGVRAAMRRLAENQKATASLRTYDDSGNQTSHSAPVPTLERWA